MNSNKNKKNNNREYHKVDTWFDIVLLENNILEFWEQNRIFQKLVEKNRDKPVWSFLDGPITANNPMGVHHAWGRTLKDVYQRYHAMIGRKLRFQNGFDCQGLWVEVEVEKELNFTSKKDIEEYGIHRFVQKCKERVEKYSQIITQQSKRLGYWMDWDNSYYTMSDENNYAIWTFLKKVHERGLLYKGHDIMPWCPRCGTGISQHEMHEGYKDIRHLSLYVRFPVKGRSKEAFLVWTTTPWTLSSNTALAVNPKIVYLKVKQKDWIYYLVKSRAGAVLNEQGPWVTEAEMTGRELMDAGFSYLGPYENLPVQKQVRSSYRIVPWDDVSEEEGTGIVHIAPGCGAEDYQLGKEFGLSVLAPLDENGVFVEGYGFLSGLPANRTAQTVKKDLEKKERLYKSEYYLHSYPHCWRCGSELLFRLVDEWFIAMDPWREEIKSAAKKIKWIPSFGLELELDWLNNMKDWLISKKRFWGLALPIWECTRCNTFTVIGSYEELKEKVIEGWDKFTGHSPHRPWLDMVKIACPSCGQPVSRVPDVGNPWLDAGIVPYSTLKYNTDKEYWQKWFPADLVLECFPGQFRNWFYSLLAMSTVMENRPPFQTLLGHALVRDERGEEMHKSKGNAIWFDTAAGQTGVEVMRWIYCRHELSSNLNFGYKAARIVRGKFINTLWNSYAFFVNYARLIEFRVPMQPVPVEHRSFFDRWILSKLQGVVNRCRTGFEQYQVRDVTRVLEEFVQLLSNWYIRNNRRRFWRSHMDNDTRAAFETLYHVMYTLIHLLAPFLPFLCEEIYQNLVIPAESWIAPEQSVHLNSYPVVESRFVDLQLEEEMILLQKWYGLGLMAREKSGIKLRQPLQRLIAAPVSDMDNDVLSRFDLLIVQELNIKNLEVLELNAEPPRDFSRWVIASDSKRWVALDVYIDDNLKSEGLMRELLRKMQVLRRKSHLEIEDRIRIRFKTDSQILNRIISQYRDKLCKELLCLELLEEPSLIDSECRRLEISAEKIFIHMSKV